MCSNEKIRTKVQDQSDIHPNEKARHNADDQTGGDQNGGHKSGLSEKSAYPKEASNAR